MPLSFPVHPYIGLLRGLAGTGQLETTTMLAGYLGGAEGGTVRLHASLEEPSEILEIAEGDVLYLADAPEAVLPSGGKYLWVKEGAQVRYLRSDSMQIEARYLAGPIAEAHLGPEQPARVPNEPPTGTTRTCAASAFCATRQCRPRTPPTWDCLPRATPTWSCGR